MITLTIYDKILVIRRGELKPRERRRKASRLGTRYSTTGLNEFFKEVQKQPSDFTPKEKEIILEVYQKGYMLKDKVIRPAMVKVNE